MSALEVEKGSPQTAWGVDRSGRYWEDFAAWAMEQAALIRAGKLDQLDLENVAEELDSLGRFQHHQLSKRLEVLIAHLLKWSYQPKRRGKSWRVTIEEQRRRVNDLLEMSPSLESSLARHYGSAYELARYRASREALIAIERFPNQPPFTLEQARNPDYWPERDSLKGSVE